jgi:hypothetical protein
VLIPTKFRAGEGNEMVHPSKPEFNNPINAIFDNKEFTVFKFETKDGSVSEHPNSDRQFERKEISPKDTPITKIQVWCN